MCWYDLPPPQPRRCRGMIHRAPPVIMMMSQIIKKIMIITTLKPSSCSDLHPGKDNSWEQLVVEAGYCVGHREKLARRLIVFFKSLEEKIYSRFTVFHILAQPWSNAAANVYLLYICFLFIFVFLWSTFVPCSSQCGRALAMRTRRESSATRAVLT